MEALKLCLIVFVVGNFEWSVNGQDVAALTSLVTSMQQQITHLQATIDKHFSNANQCSGIQALPKDCYDLSVSGQNTSGVHTVYPTSLAGAGVTVYCDMDDDGGGWLVIQKRVDGKENFFRSWKDYEDGFGNKTHEHWIGNKIIHAVTSGGQYELKVTLTDYQQNTKTAKYRSFSVQDKDHKYQLSVDGYSGTAGDSLQFDHNDHQFSTADSDNDGAKTQNCAQLHQGGYWYSNCMKSNINGKWGVAGDTGIIWGSFKNWDVYVLKETEMKIRPTSANTP